jgi:hypothetical protein
LPCDSRLEWEAMKLLAMGWTRETSKDVLR